MAGGPNKYSDLENDFSRLSKSKRYELFQEIKAVFKKFVPKFTGSVQIHIIHGEAKKMTTSHTIKLKSEK